jgi:hypothetical protein
LRVQNNVFKSLFNRPLDMVMRFFTAPFTSMEPLDMDRIVDIYFNSSTEHILYLIVIFIFLLPFAFASAEMLLLPISSFITSKFKRNYAPLLVLVVVYAFLGITFFAAYHVDEINGFVFESALNSLSITFDRQGYSTNIVPAVKIMQIYLSALITGSLLMFATSFPLSKRYFNVI